MKYQLVLNQLDEILKNDEKVTILSNFVALLYDSFDHINWLGFYIYKDNMLKLGPFQGKVACERIPLGKGVCGYAAKNRVVTNVEDVHKFPGHIACDSASESELVIPIVIEGKLIGVLDIDSPIKKRFDEETEQFFKEAVVHLINRWESFHSSALL